MYKTIGANILMCVWQIRVVAAAPHAPAEPFLNTVTNQCDSQSPEQTSRDRQDGRCRQTGVSPHTAANFWLYDKHYWHNRLTDEEPSITVNLLSFFGVYLCRSRRIRERIAMLNEHLYAERKQDSRDIDAQNSSVGNKPSLVTPIRWTPHMIC